MKETDMTWLKFLNAMKRSGAKVGMDLHVNPRRDDGVWIATDGFCGTHSCINVGGGAPMIEMGEYKGRCRRREELLARQLVEDGFTVALMVQFYKNIKGENFIVNPIGQVTVVHPGCEHQHLER